MPWLHQKSVFNFERASMRPATGVRAGGNRCFPPFPAGFQHERRREPLSPNFPPFSYLFVPAGFSIFPAVSRHFEPAEMAGFPAVIVLLRCKTAKQFQEVHQSMMPCGSTDSSSHYREF
jgi:hypothetical protein